MTREISRKITDQTITGGYRAWFGKLQGMSLEKVGDELKPISPAPVLPLYRVIGFVHNGKPGSSEYGEYIKFLGQFRATNLFGDTAGVQTDAPAMFLPGFLAESLWGVLSAPGRSGPVQIALEFGVVYAEEASTKYKFIVRDVLPPSESDPLALLESSVKSGQPLLSAPVGATNEQAPAAAPAATPAPTPAPAPAGKKGK